MTSKNYDSVLKDLDVICGCTRAAKNAEAAIRELIVQRDELLQFVQRLDLTLQRHGLIERELLDLIHNECRAAISKAGDAQ